MRSSACLRARCGHVECGTDPACTEEATDLTIPIAVAVKDNGRIFAAASALIAGEAAVVEVITTP